MQLSARQLIYRLPPRQALTCTKVSPQLRQGCTITFSRSDKPQLAAKFHEGFTTFHDSSFTTAAVAATSACSCLLSGFSLGFLQLRERPNVHCGLKWHYFKRIRIDLERFCNAYFVVANWLRQVCTLTLVTKQCHHQRKPFCRVAPRHTLAYIFWFHSWWKYIT